jgi:hypothetical protein
MPAWCNSSTWSFGLQGTGAIPEQVPFSNEIRLERYSGVLQPGPLHSRVHGAVRVYNGVVDEGQEARRFCDAPAASSNAGDNPHQQRNEKIRRSFTTCIDRHRQVIPLRRLWTRPRVEREETRAGRGSRGWLRYRSPSTEFRISMPELPLTNTDVGVQGQSVPCSSGVERWSLKPDVLGANPSAAANFSQQ